MTTFIETLNTAPDIRLFLGVVTLNEGDREQPAAVYTPSKIDRVYMEFTHNAESGTGLKPCGKTRLRPEMTFTDEGGQTHKGVVLVPADKADAILEGCSMQKGRITDELVQAQRQQYQRGHAALQAPTAG